MRSVESEDLRKLPTITLRPPHCSSASTAQWLMIKAITSLLDDHTTGELHKDLARRKAMDRHLHRNNSILPKVMINTRKMDMDMKGTIMDMHKIIMEMGGIRI